MNQTSASIAAFAAVALAVVTVFGAMKAVSQMNAHMERMQEQMDSMKASSSTRRRPRSDSGSADEDESSSERDSSNGKISAKEKDQSERLVRALEAFAESNQTEKTQAEKRSALAVRSPSEHLAAVAMWTCADVQKWVHAELSTRLPPTLEDPKGEARLKVYLDAFSTTSGLVLIDLIVAEDHGFCFADKLFYMGLEKDACLALQASAKRLMLGSQKP